MFFKLLAAVLVVLYILAPNFFERNFFINELLSLLGIVYFSLNYSFFLKQPVVKGAIPFLLCVVVYWIASIPTHDNTEILIRRLSIIYSMFTMFSFYFAYDLLFNTKLKHALLFPLHKVNALASLMAYFTTISDSYRTFALTTLLSLFIYTAIFGGSTAIVAFLLALLIVLFRPTKYVIVALTIIGMTYLHVTIFGPTAILQKYHLTNLYTLADSYPILAVDGNMSVRLIMWYKILVESFTENIGIGIGFGSVIFDRSFISFLGLGSQIVFDRNIEYTLSPHNSYIFILLTMGLPGIFTLAYFYYQTFLFNKTTKSTNTQMFFLLFIAFTIAAAFNVVIESPIHSGIYWGLIGFYIRSVIIYEEE